MNKDMERCLFDLNRAFENERLQVELPERTIEVDQITRLSYSRTDGMEIKFQTTEPIDNFYEIENVSVWGDQHIWQLHVPILDSTFATFDDKIVQYVTLEWAFVEEPLWRKP